MVSLFFYESAGDSSDGGENSKWNTLLNVKKKKNDSEDFLAHHGVKGQKWGVRRYQNKDGSLTPKGKKHYDSMSDDKLQKTLYKQVKRARSEQSGKSNQWNIHNTIGKYSKAAQEKYYKDKDKYKNSDSYKQAEKKLKKLDDKFNKEEIDPDQYDIEYENILNSIYRADLDNSVRYGSKGREYSKAYLDQYGKDMNIAYLKDLGYDDSTAKEFTERILKANKKLLNGM